MERMVVPRLVAGSGLAPGAGVSVAYSPVRVDPGNEGSSVRTLPRVVAGATPRCREAAERLLGRFTEQLVPVGSLRAAELVKVFENTFRLVNILLVNELAAVCRASHVDFAEVLDAAIVDFGEQVQFDQIVQYELCLVHGSIGHGRGHFHPE
jgi:UDP-N-acetyl-D-glucosamine dehydrogenase